MSNEKRHNFLKKHFKKQITSGKSLYKNMKNIIKLPYNSENNKTDKKNNQFFSGKICLIAFHNQVKIKESVLHSETKS